MIDPSLVRKTKNLGKEHLGARGDTHLQRRHTPGIHVQEFLISKVPQCLYWFLSPGKAIVKFASLSSCFILTVGAAEVRWTHSKLQNKGSCWSDEMLIYFCFVF